MRMHTKTIDNESHTHVTSSSLRPWLSSTEAMMRVLLVLLCKIALNATFENQNHSTKQASLSVCIIAS